MGEKLFVCEQDFLIIRLDNNKYYKWYFSIFKIVNFLYK